jgi:Diacylglycerol kinase catalytic domain
MAGMERQRRRAANVWTGLLERLAARWGFALGARRAPGAESVEAIVGDVPTTPEAPAARSEAASQVPPAQVHSFQRPVLVLNPRSGSAQAVREQLLEAAGRYGIQLDEAATPAGLVALARQAVADGADVLGVAGGDGSLAAVAAVAIEAELPFVCVPAGTRNHFAGDLGLDRADPAAAIEAFVAGPERRVDVATVGERLFLNNASIGIYAALVHEPSYRDDWLRAVSGVLESMLERDVLPVQVSFRDGSGNHWDQVLILFVFAAGHRGAAAVGRRGDAGHAAMPQDQRERAVQQALTLGEVGANQGEAGSEHRVQIHTPAPRLASLSVVGAGLAAGGRPAGSASPSRR